MSNSVAGPSPCIFIHKLYSNVQNVENYLTTRAHHSSFKVMEEAHVWWHIVQAKRLKDVALRPTVQGCAQLHLFGVQAEMIPKQFS